eukprot:4060687-Pyramimonas_sp.AAC.2
MFSACTCHHGYSGQVIASDLAFSAHKLRTYSDQISPSLSAIMLFVVQHVCRASPSVGLQGLTQQSSEVLPRGPQKTYREIPRNIQQPSDPQHRHCDGTGRRPVGHGIAKARVRHHLGERVRGAAMPGGPRGSADTVVMHALPPRGSSWERDRPTPGRPPSPPRTWPRSTGMQAPSLSHVGFGAEGPTKSGQSGSLDSGRNGVTSPAERLS